MSPNTFEDPSDTASSQTFGIERQGLHLLARCALLNDSVLPKTDEKAQVKAQVENYLTKWPSGVMSTHLRAACTALLSGR